MTPLLNAFRLIALSEPMNTYPDRYYSDNKLRVEEVFFRDIHLNLRRWTHIESDCRYVFETDDYWYSFWYENNPRYDDHGVIQLRRFDIDSNKEIGTWGSSYELREIRQKWPIDFAITAEELTW